MYICKFCGRCSTSKQGNANHESSCKANPNRNIRVSHLKGKSASNCESIKRRINYFYPFYRLKHKENSKNKQGLIAPMSHRYKHKTYQSIENQYLAREKCSVNKYKERQNKSNTYLNQNGVATFEQLPAPKKDK